MSIVAPPQCFMRWWSGRVCKTFHKPSTLQRRFSLTGMLFWLFYTCQLKFINFKLYNDEGYAYPPALEAGRDDGGLGLAAVQVRKVGAATAPALEDVRHTRLLLPCADPGR